MGRIFPANPLAATFSFRSPTIPAETSVATIPETQSEIVIASSPVPHPTSMR